jgi:hypothetical protein
MSFKKLNHLSKKIPQTMCYERHSFILKLHNLRQKLDQHKLDDLTQNFLIFLTAQVYRLIKLISNLMNLNRGFL